MGEFKKSLSKAKLELEELYLGIPDDSVNLTFQDLAAVTNNNSNVVQPEKTKKSHSNMEAIQESKLSTPRHGNPIPEARTSSNPKNVPKKLPSLDFNRGLQAAANTNHHHHQHHGHYHDSDMEMMHASSHGYHHHNNHHVHDGGRHHHHHEVHHGHGVGTNSHSMAYDDVSVRSMAQERGRPRRPGIPHSNICTICSTYIYIFRHRCLVCGRAYCRNCVSIGMGEMPEGRKCIQCLGKRFSQRYIQRAGMVGCCSRYPRGVKQAELKWAEKGPRRSSGADRAFGHSHSTMMSRSRSPVTPRTPTSNSPSFVANSMYSPYSSNHHHLPL